MAAIDIAGLTKVFPGGVRALDALDLSIVDGEFFALLGPSGCGKTTLLRTIAGLESATEGTVHIGARNVTALPPGARDVAMVFQDYALFPHMTVEDNIGYPLKIRRQPKASRSAQARQVASQLGLERLMARRPAELSGGQQQRVALARAVACRPSVFLFDEPLSNLDARLRLEARTFLKRLQRELGVTTIFVTHDQAEALALADRIAVMDAGRIRQLGTPRQVFGKPANTFVANFIGSTPMNLLAAVAVPGGVEICGHPLPVPVDLRDGEKVTVGIRPEYLTLTHTPGAIPGAVSIVEHLGTSSLVTVDVQGLRDGGSVGGVSTGLLVVGAVVPEDAEPEPGAQVWLTPVAGRVLVYREGELVA